MSNELKTQFHLLGPVVSRRGLQHEAVEPVVELADLVRRPEPGVAAVPLARAAERVRAHQRSSLRMENI